LCNISIKIEVVSYNPEASVQQGTDDPDLELDIWNGTAWVTIGTFNLNETYTGESLNITNANFTLTTTDAGILSAWQSSSNQDIRIRGVYMDYYNETTIDEINYTNVWVIIDGKKWTVIGNHTENSTLSWDTSNFSGQDCVNFRARAIDLEGDNTYSDYYTRDCCMNISPADSPPNVILNSPENNANLSNATITFNCTASDDINLENVTLYVWNSTGGLYYNETNSTPQNNTPAIFTKTVTPDGNYTWNCEACDNATTPQCVFNESNRTFTVDSNAPIWYDNETNIVSEYSPSTPGYFNISWNDTTLGVDTVYFESNYSGTPQNYTMNLISGDANSGIYNYSAILPAGTHYWKSYANDTINNTNVTDIWYFTINKAVGEVNLTINGSDSDFGPYNVSFEASINCTAVTPISGNLTIYEDGAVIASAVGTYVNVTRTYTSAGNYNITCMLLNHQNYTASEQQWINATSADDAPDVTLNSPGNNANLSNATVTFNCTVWDDINLINVTLNIWNSTGGLYYNETNSSGANNTDYIFTKTITPDGNYTWNCEACDNNSQCSFYTTNRTFTVDTTPPSVTNLQDTGPVEIYNYINISADVTDSSPVDTVLIEITFPDLTKQNYTVTVSGDTYYNDTINCTQLGLHAYRIYANDTLGNLNSTENGTFTVQDTNPPFISIESPLNQTYNTSSIWFNVTAADPSGISQCWYSIDSGSNVTMNNDTPTHFYYLNSSVLDGYHNVTFYCNDTTGNENSTTRYFTIDAIPPTINLEFPANNTENTTDSTPDFRFNASDNLAGTLNCSLWLENSTGSSQVYDTNETALNDTSTKLTPQTSLLNGWYWWWVNCSDGVNTNVSEQRNISINIPDVTPPIINLESPGNNSGTNSANVTFYYNVSDDSEIANCTIYLYNSTKCYKHLCREKYDAKFHNK